MAVLSKKEKMELAEVIAKAVVTALKENSSNSQGSTKGRKSKNEGTSSDSQKKTTTSKKLTIADFEPKGSKSAKGYMNWSSYKSQRTKYCYYVATNGEVTDGKVFGTPWYGNIDFSEKGAFAKAKAEYSKKYHYIKVEDR